MMDTVSEVTIRCLIAILDSHKVINIQIRKDNNYDVILVNRGGIVPLRYYLPRDEGEYIARAWGGELNAVVNELLSKAWRYDGNVRPKTLYSIALTSYLNYQTPYHLLIINKLATNGINDWSEQDVTNIEKSGHCEVLLYI